MLQPLNQSSPYLQCHLSHSKKVYFSSHLYPQLSVLRTFQSRELAGTILFISLIVLSPFAQRFASSLEIPRESSQRFPNWWNFIFHSLVYYFVFSTNNLVSWCSLCSPLLLLLPQTLNLSLLCWFPQADLHTNQASSRSWVMETLWVFCSTHWDSQVSLSRVSAFWNVEGKHRLLNKTQARFSQTQIVAIETMSLLAKISQLSSTQTAVSHSTFKPVFRWQISFLLLSRFDHLTHIFATNFEFLSWVDWRVHSMIHFHVSKCQRWIA